MKLQTETKVKKEITIIPPAFYRISEWEVVAFLDDNTVLDAYLSEDLTAVSKKHPRFFYGQENIIDENIITEEEFFDKYNAACDFLNMKPQLVHAH